MPFKAIDQENFLANHPLNFLLFYGDYEIINTVYLDDGSPLIDLSLELFNQSPTQTVKFEKPNNLSASANNCHFFLNLGGYFTLEEAPEGWDIDVEQSRSETGDNFYFLKKEGYDLQQKPANGSTNKIVLKLKKFRAALEGGTRTIRAELTYGPLLKDKNNRPFQNEYGEYSSYGNTIFITNNRGGKKTLPLQVDFAAGNAVLNDGTSTNSLELLIANKNWPNNSLSLSSDSQFVISFETGDTAKEGAVATDTQVKNIAINTSQSNKWDVQHVANSTEWTVKPKQGTDQLASNEAIKLNITNLVTNHSSGAGYLYVRYQNIPNYPDGQLVVPIEKTPLLYHAGQVGIGINNPSAKLHVNSGNAIIANKLAIGTTQSPTIHVAIGDGDTGLNQQGDGKLAIYTDSVERVRIDENGRIGIGTSAPSAKLHVSGGDAIVSGKVGIGTDAPSDKLHVDGNVRLTGNINGANQKLSIYSNTTAGNSNAWIELWGKTNNDSNRTGELSLTGKYIEFRYNSTDSTNGSVGMRLTSEGKVGIGTTTPSAKLHVEDGDAIVSGKFAIGTTVSSHIHLTIGDNDTGLKQQGDGKLAIYTDSVERVRIEKNGNVGIGTTDPQIHLAIGDNDTGLNQQGDGKLAIYTDSVERVRIEKNGNVGIGTTNPQQKLDVSGGIRLSEVPVWDGAGAYDATWNPSTGQISREGSSQRYKKNITSLEEDFQKILILEPKQYQMKEGSGDPNTWEFGYLAEDLDKIGLKSLVIYDRSGQPDGIQYKKMCIYLNEVVKSQQSSMERLEEKVNELNEKLISFL